MLLWERLPAAIVLAESVELVDLLDAVVEVGVELGCRDFAARAEYVFEEVLATNQSKEFLCCLGGEIGVVWSSG